MSYNGVITHPLTMSLKMPTTNPTSEGCENVTFNKLEHTSIYQPLEMNLTGESTCRMRFIEILSDYRIVFGVISTLIVCLVLEVSIVNVSGFSTPHDSVGDIPIFSILGILSIISQIIILNFLHTRKVPFDKSILRAINASMLSTQLAIIIMLTIILVEVNFTHSYYLVHLELVFIISSVTAIAAMGLLSYKFLTWLKFNKNIITIAYLSASLSLSVNVIIGILYVSDQFSYVSDVITPTPYGVFFMHTHYSFLAFLYTISSAVTFVLFWIGTVLLLRSYRKRIGTIKFWLIMIVPLLYFLSQFQPILSNMLFDYSSGNPILFSIVYVMMLEVSTPIGGILFGAAFLLVANKIQNAKVKGYLVISGIGLLLLLISYRPQEIITGPFPPFGILSASFMGLSSYLIFVGIYSSAISVSQDSKFRTTIRKSVEAEVSFVGNIASAEQTRTVTENVLKKVKNVSEKIEEDTQVATSMTESEIRNYISDVINETRKLRH